MTGETDPTLKEIAKHEAAHAVVARALGIEVVHATAAAKDAHVKTRCRASPATLEKLAIVDLAGLAVDYSRAACEMDLRNATNHAQRVVLMRHGLAEDGLTDELRAEAAELVERLRVSAGAKSGRDRARRGRARRGRAVESGRH
jgi:hypothetical protein